MLLSRYPADPAELDPDEREDLREDLESSAAAVDEVLKFLPDGAETAPESAFWSVRGRAIRQAEPGRFDRYWLEARRDAYLAGAAALA